MRYILPVTKIVAGIVVLLGVILVSHALAERFQGGENLDESSTQESGKEVSKPLVVEGHSINELAAKLKKASLSSGYEPGEKAFIQAKELLATGFYFEAEQKLNELNLKYSFAPSVFEARRILGIMNVDRFLTDPKVGGKIFYKVKSGDSYIKIANNNETSLANLMLINGLFSFNNLHKGEELMVMPLRCNLVIDVPNKRLTLEYGKSFLKDYPFKKLVSTEGKGVKKIINIDRPILEIVGDDYEVDDEFQGIILKRSDIEELAVLLRKGNLVEIRY